VDGNGNPTTTGGPCIEVDQDATTVEVTSMSMTVTATVAGIGVPITQTTGTLLMRIGTGSPAAAYIINEPGVATAEIVSPTVALVDAPDLIIPPLPFIGTITHNLHSYPTNVVLKGALTYLPDGRLQASLVNLQAISLDTVLAVPIIGNGTISLTIPQGQLHMTLVGPPIK